MKKDLPEFWVTNISKLNVSLGDLRFSIPAGKSFNLLDSKHFHYTLEQLQKSAESGSLFKKRDKIILRKNSPLNDHNVIKLEVSSVPFPHRKRTTIKVEHKVYEELQLSDEKFAEEFSDDLLWDPKKKK